MNEYISIKRGRPVKYFDEQERAEAQKEYRKRWYLKNRDKVKESYNPDKVKANRKKRILSGYYCIYSDEPDLLIYYGFSKDIKARVNDILKNIRNIESSSPLIDKFSKNVEWRYKMLTFIDQKDDNILDGIKTDWVNFYEL